MPNFGRDDDEGQRRPGSDLPQPLDLLKSAFFGFLSYLYGLLLLIGGVFGLVLRGVRSILNQAGTLVGRPPRTYIDRSLSPIGQNKTIVLPPEYKLDRVWFAGRLLDRSGARRCCDLPARPPWNSQIQTASGPERHSSPGCPSRRLPQRRKGTRPHLGVSYLTPSKFD